MTECFICEKAELERRRVPYSYHDWYFGDYEADVCPACGEAFFTEAASDAMDARARELGVWGLERDGTVGRSGNSLMVRIPRALADFLRLQAGARVHLTPEGPRKFSVEMGEEGDG